MSHLFASFMGIGYKNEYGAEVNNQQGSDHRQILIESEYYIGVIGGIQLDDGLLGDATELTHSWVVGLLQRALKTRAPPDPAYTVYVKFAADLCTHQGVR